VTTIAVLPVKRFAGAKQRLEGVLADGSRRALAEAMVTDVLVALRRARSVDRVIVVTAEHAAEALARGYGAETLHEPRQEGHNAAAALGVAAAVGRGASRVVLVPGDCPALAPGELDALLARPAAAEHEVLVVPDRHRTGTNALVLTPPDVIAPSFGPGSCARHLAAAQTAGAAASLEELPSLMLDVDTAEDLEALRAALAGSTGGAAHTRGMLSRHDAMSDEAS